MRIWSAFSYLGGDRYEGYFFRDRLDRQDVSGYRETDCIQVSGGKPYDESSVSVATIEGGIQRGCLFFHKIAGGYNGTEGRGFSCAGLLDP